MFLIPNRRLHHGMDFELTKKVYAKIHEEVYLKINKRQKERYRIMISHRPVNPQTVMLYVNGALMIQGAKYDYQIEGQSLFITARRLNKGEHVLVLRYDYLADI